MDRGIAIISIGDKVLRGAAVNTNAACIADTLVHRGYRPVCHLVVADDPQEIGDAISRELRARRDVIVTGGLGPTVDDHTKAVVADLFSRPLVRHDDLYAALVARYGAEYPTLEHQSLQPQGAVLFPNSVGTAPGLLLEDERLFPQARLFALPGPPHEMRDVLFHGILPQWFAEKTALWKSFLLVSRKEHEVDPFLRKLGREYPMVRMGIYPSYELVRVHLSVETPADAESLDKAAVRFRKAFGVWLLPEGTTSLEGAVHGLLLDRGWTIATAESCTGGALAARLTSLPGSSEVVLGGVVAYQDSVKEVLLAVPPDVLETCGAVSTEVTESMALGAQALFGAQAVCAVSGFFGPGGGTSEAPVGTVCVSFVLPGGMVSERWSFHGTRESICEKAIQATLARLMVLLLQEQAP